MACRRRICKREKDRVARGLPKSCILAYPSHFFFYIIRNFLLLIKFAASERSPNKTKHRAAYIAFDRKMQSERRRRLFPKPVVLDLYS